MKRGEHTPESERRRKQLQRRKKRYMELREELTLAGVIPTEPAGAIRDERVDPATQGGQALPALIGEAIRKGWAVPEEKKPGFVDELGAIIENPEESNKVKVAAFNALRMADKDQWERDHPEVGTTEKGPTTLNVNIVNVDGSPTRDVSPLEVLLQEDRRGEEMKEILALPEVEVVPSADTSTNGG